MLIREVIDKVDERYGMSRGGGAMQRSYMDQQKNANKRINNRTADASREAQIDAMAKNRRANRLAKKIPTGLPTRLLNPQQAQAPQG